MAQLRVALTTESVSPDAVRGFVCVVIDVLRASTTIVTALANGCSAVFPVETPEEARQIAKERDSLLGGERGGVKLEGFDFGNSPLEYAPEMIQGRTLAFTTTNGTRAIKRCADSDLLLVGCFLNASEIIRFLERENRDTYILCAGTRGKPSLEDTACGGMMLERLGAHGIAETREAVSIWRNCRNDLARTMKTSSAHGRNLVRLGFERDIDFAAETDRFRLLAMRENDGIVRIKP